MEWSSNIQPVFDIFSTTLNSVAFREKLVWFREKLVFVTFFLPCSSQLQTSKIRVMNKIFSLIMLLVLSTGIIAQETPPVPETPVSPATPDTTRIKLGTLNVTIVDEGDEGDENAEDENDGDEGEDSFSAHWEGIDLGINVLMNANNSTSLGDDEWLNLDYGRSLNWSFNMFQHYFPIAKENFGIVTGIGLNYKSFGLKNNVTVTANSDSTFAVVTPDSLYSFDKNKLRATYLRVPLMFEINTNPKNGKTFHVTAGVTGGLRIGSITKQEFKTGDNEVRSRVKNDFNLNDFQVDGSLRIGHGNLTFWMNYALLPLFDKNKGPEVYAMSAGICLIPF